MPDNLKTSISTLLFVIAIIFIHGCKKEEEVTLPQIKTAEVTEIGTNNVTTGGILVSDGNAVITAHGICWGDLDKPSLAANVIPDTVVTGEGPFVCRISNLLPGYVYYVRAFATNSAGTAYGETLSFTTAVSAPEISSKLNAAQITTSGAVLSGFINSMSLTTEVFFEYGLSLNYENSVPAIQNPLIQRGSCVVSAELNNILPGSVYHFRIKAINQIGTSYSSDQTFTTTGWLPEVTNTSLTKITMNSVVIHTKIDPRLVETNVFIEYGTTSQYGSVFTALVIPPVDVNQVDIRVGNLLSDTRYFFRVRAVNKVGTTYSSELSCTTFSVMDVDSNYYHTITTGNQVWLQENLMTLHYQNGDPIAVLPFDNEWSATTIGACTYYYYDLDLGRKYGFLYNYYAAADARNVCPAGWHVPSQAEWSTLIAWAGGEAVAAPKMRIAGISNWNPLYYTESDNSSGFTALGAGTRLKDGEYWGISYNATFWTLTPWSYDPVLINTLRIFEDKPNTDFSPQWKNAGVSIRCLKN